MSASSLLAPGRGIKRGIASLLRGVVPLGLRQRAAVWVGRQAWIPHRQWRAASLVSDLAGRDPEAYHRFLWSHHLAYAESYEPQLRFGRDKIKPDRHQLFDDLRAFLLERGLAPERDVRSILEVGCSLGHLLRFMETDLFPAAQVLEGFDIDEHAVRSGNAWLAGQGSRVRLSTADMTRMDAALPSDARYDIVLCAGVLMYLREEQAAAVVQAILPRAAKLLVMTGLAHPRMDNRELARSEPRSRDGAFRHNLDAMVERAGGKVRFRRWAASAPLGWNPPYFVFCDRQGD